jgi:hypothetical protein
MNMKTRYLCFFGFIIGLVAWGIGERYVVFAPLVVLLWRRAEARFPAFSVMLAYYAASSRGIVGGAPVFFGSSALLPHHYGVMLWLGSSIVLAAPWWFCWSRRFQPASYALRLSLAFAASMVPPLAVIGWTNPILAAGLFPFAPGWWGFPLLIALLVWVSWLDSRLGDIKKILPVASCVCAFILFLPFSFPSLPEGWKGIDTSFGRLASGSSPAYEDWERAVALRPLLKQLVNESEPRVLVLPETIVGAWNPLLEAVWLPSIEEITATGKTVVLGTELWDGDYYDNAMLFFHPDGTRVEARQRVPVPVSMYRPWEKRGARAYWLDNGIVESNGKKILVLICYEQFLTWPFLLSMYYGEADVDVVVATANDWWCRSTNLPRIQTQTVRLLCRLFGQPLVTARNL